jgi:hypothetical protein
MQVGLGHARVEFRFGVVDALLHAAFTALRRCLGVLAPGSGIGGGLELRGVGR